MDYKEYKALYSQLMSDQGRAELGDDTKRRDEIETKINDFLAKYPAVVPKDKDAATPFHLLSLKEIFHRTMLAAIDIINEVSNVLSMQPSLSNADFRRQLFRAFTKKERRIYVGIWLLIFAFILLIIDGSSGGDK